MPPPTSPTRSFLVTLRLRAPAPAPPTAPRQVLEMLRAAESSPWSEVEADLVDGGAAIELRLLAWGSDAEPVGRAVVDGVRGVTGLDAAFTRWIVDARHIGVRPTSL